MLNSGLNTFLPQPPPKGDMWVYKKLQSVMNIHIEDQWVNGLHLPKV
jgi:hypothetical protein